MEILVIGSPNGNTANLLAPIIAAKWEEKEWVEGVYGGDKWLFLGCSWDADGIFKIYNKKTENVKGIT